MTELQEGLVAPAAVADPAPATPENRARTSWVRSVLKHVAMIAVSFVMIYPLLWLLVSSFRPTDVIFRTPGLWLNDLVVENYTQGWFALGQPFGHYIVNSVIVVASATTIVMVLHDLNLAARYADHLITLAGGRMRAAGRPEEVLTEATVRTVFGLDNQIITDPTSGKPLVLPLGRHHVC